MGRGMMLEIKPKSTLGLNASGRIDWQDEDNKKCVKMLRRGCFYYSTISRVLGFSIGQISERARQKDLLARPFRKGESQTAKIWIERYIVINGHGSKR